MLDGISREIVLVDELLDSISAYDSYLNTQLVALTDSLEVARKRLDNARDAQAEVVRAMYIRGREAEWAFLLGGSSFGDFIKRLGYFIFLARAKREFAESTHRQAERVSDILDSTATVKLEVSENKAIMETTLDSLNLAKREQGKLLGEIRQDKEAYQRAIAEMERSLEELTRRLPEAITTGEFERNRGRLPWPTDSREILHPFGIVTERRFGTNFRNAGIDIATEPEEPVRAVAEGVVVHIYWLRGYGQIVILKHKGGFFSIYGNLGKVVVLKDQKIDAGSTIGYTAADGWLEGAKLHFEIRKGKQEVNPVEWLIAA